MQGRRVNTSGGMNVSVVTSTASGPRPAFALPGNLAISATGEIITENQNPTPTPEPTATPDPTTTPSPSPQPTPSPPPGGNDNGNINDGEGLLGLITTLIRITEETQAQAYQATERVQQVNMWQITITAFTAAILLVLIYASAWRSGA